MYNLIRFFPCAIAMIFLANCSINDVTSLWPSGSDNNEEIVIREIPSESFDPEDTEDILVTAENTDEVNVIDEINTGSDQEIPDILDGESGNEEDSSVSVSRANLNVPTILTYVGERIIEMREEYSNLDSDINSRLVQFEKLKADGIMSAEVYHSTVAAISARLQIGTTPGNPILLDQYEKAQTELAEVGSQGQQIVDLGNKIALLSARVSYLKDQTRSAKRLRGAVDEDHRKLSSLQDDIKRRTVDIARLLENLNETVRRRDIYLAAERRRLTLLANAISVGESFGLGLGTLNSISPPDEEGNSNLQERSSDNVSGNPIAVLRIKGESIKYNQGLYGAVSAALERLPDARFTLVAVSSSVGNASEKAERAANAREKAGKVVSSLISMGMPADRLNVTEVAIAEVEDTEVRVYAD